MKILSDGLVDAGILNAKTAKRYLRVIKGKRSCLHIGELGKVGLLKLLIELPDANYRETIILDPQGLMPFGT